MLEIINQIPPDALSAFMALAQLGIIKLSKKTGIDTRLIVAIVTASIAGLYTLYTSQLDIEAQKTVAAFTGQTFITQWALYELWKSRKTSAK